MGTASIGSFRLANQVAFPVDLPPSQAGSGRFLLYLEGPRDREILKHWCRRAFPGLARAVDSSTILLGGRQPARAVEHHRALREEDPSACGICILDRDGLPEARADFENTPGLTLFTWPRRHIESYLLVPSAIRRSLPRSRETAGLERALAEVLPDVGDEEAFREMDAKRLLSGRGPVWQVAGHPLRPGRIARNMVKAELHADVMELLFRIREGFGLGDRKILVVQKRVSAALS